MKRYLILFAAIASWVAAHESSFVPELRAPERFSRLVEKADYATVELVVRGEKEPRMKTLTLRERGWIEQCAKILGAAIYRPESHVFAVSAPVIFFDREGKRILALAVLPGEILRLDSDDYRVGAQACAAIVALIKQAEAEQRAGAESRPAAPVQPVQH